MASYSSLAFDDVFGKNRFFSFARFGPRKSPKRAKHLILRISSNINRIRKIKLAKGRIGYSLYLLQKKIGQKRSIGTF